MGETEIVKPKGPKGVWCPLWRRECIKVCHTCKLWLPVEMTARHPQTGEVNQKVWDCAFNHAILVQLDTGRRVERVAAETERAGKQTEKVRASLMALAMQAEQLAAPSGPAQQLIEEDPTNGGQNIDGRT